MANKAAAVTCWWSGGSLAALHDHLVDALQQFSEMGHNTKQKIGQAGKEDGEGSVGQCPNDKEREYGPA